MGEATKNHSLIWQTLETGGLRGSSHVRESKSCLVESPGVIQHGTFLAGPSRTWQSAGGGAPRHLQETLGSTLPGAWDRAPSIGNARQGSGDSSPTSEQDTE